MPTCLGIFFQIQIENRRQNIKSFYQPGYGGFNLFISDMEAVIDWKTEEWGAAVVLTALCGYRSGNPSARQYAVTLKYENTLATYNIIVISQ